MLTVSYNEFHRERRKVEIEMNKDFDGVDRIWFVDTSDNEVVKMGISLGGSNFTISEAEIFSKAVGNAVELAKNFKYNGYRKTY